MADTAKAPSEGTAPKANDSGPNGLGPGRVSSLQRARILGAMAAVSAELGASNVTVANVVSRSGVSRRTFYEMFLDREECFLATLEDALTCAEQYVGEAYRGPTRWQERMRAAIAAFLSFLDDEPYRGRVLVSESLGAGARALERRKQVLAVVVAAVDEGRLSSKRGEGLPPLTAEGVVGGALWVIHARLQESGEHALLELAGPLMSMVVLPYLGQAAAGRELEQPRPVHLDRRARPPVDLLRDIEMRLTYRTVRVLTAVASKPGSSNRELGLASGIQDQGQISKLLTRLAGLGLIANTGVGMARGAPNAWTLTGKGAEMEAALGGQVG